MASPLLSELTLETVIQECRAEARQDRRSESGYCRELFRRALDEKDAGAWAAVDAQYRRLVLQWIHSSDRGVLDGGEADDAASDALARFWKSLNSQEAPVAGRFPHVGALLGYLQRCAVCEVQARRRQAQRARLLDARLEQGQAVIPLARTPETLALDALTRADRIAEVRAWIRDHVGDPAERTLLDCVYRQGLAPVEIARRHPDVFEDVKQVYRVHERLLKRARRALAEAPHKAETRPPEH